jgi:hypothetical protein
MPQVTTEHDTKDSTQQEPCTYTKLRTIDVNAYVEKKNGLSYLSWAWAVDQLLMRDPAATWDYRFTTDLTGHSVPFLHIGDTAMVFCTVNAFGVSRTAQLPVMDYKNRPIPNPNAFEVNTAMQRCLAKAIALHGIGLYIYNGEDLPPEGDAAQEAKKPEPKKPEPKVTAAQLAKAKQDLTACKTVDALRATYSALHEDLKAPLKEFSAALAKGLD